MVEHLPVLMVVTPLTFSFIVNVAGMWKRWLCFPLVFIPMMACTFFAFAILLKVTTAGEIRYHLGGWPPPWGIEYCIDHFSALVLLGVAVISLLVSIYAYSSFKKEVDGYRSPQLYALFLLQTTGLFGITATADLFNLYVLLEIASFSAYAIIAMGERGADFAAFRYVIFGTIGACAYLLATGYIYILTGSLNMTDVAQRLPRLYSSRALLVGFTFFLLGAGIKMGIFPLHSWLPDAYTLAPSAVSTLLAPLFSKVGGYVIIRIMFTVFDSSFSIDVFPVTDLLGLIGGIGVIVACVMAVAQTDLKRMLCYVIVAEMGYVVIGIASANRLGLTGAILHIINDMFMMACLFAAAGAIFYQMGTKEISRLSCLHRQMPVTSAVFVLGALSVIGVPPLCGFFSKWYLLLGAIKSGQWILIAVLLISSLIYAIIFFRVIEYAYLKRRVNHMRPGKSGQHPFQLDKVPISMLVPMILLALGIIILGIFSGTIVTDIIEFALPSSISG